MALSMLVLPLCVAILPLLLTASRSGPAISQISIDYTLLGPQNGKHIINDVQDALHFIHDELNSRLAGLSKGAIDPERIAVCGSSAGGYMSYIAVGGGFSELACA